MYDVFSNLQVYGYLAYLFLFLGAYFETLIGVGFFISGEVVFLAGATLAGIGALNIWLVFLVCVLGGVSGDVTSFFLGKYFGKNLFKKGNRFFNEKMLNSGEQFFNTRGAKAVFFARLLGPLSWVTPFLAGIYKLEFKKFIKYNICGVIVGIGLFMILGYMLGYSYFALVQQYSNYFLLILIIFILIFIFILIRNNIKNILKDDDVKN